MQTGPLLMRNATIRIRWRNDVQETARVVYDGFPWDIKGIAEIGFRRELRPYLPDGCTPRGSLCLPR